MLLKRLYLNFRMVTKKGGCDAHSFPRFHSYTKTYNRPVYKTGFGNTIERGFIR